MHWQYEKEKGSRNFIDQRRTAKAAEEEKLSVGALKRVIASSVFSIASIILASYI
jgi:hypothetical protein